MRTVEERAATLVEAILSLAEKATGGEFLFGVIAEKGSRAVRAGALEEIRIAVVKALRDYNPGGRWNWEGYEDEAVEVVEAALRALAAGDTP